MTPKKHVENLVRLLRKGVPRAEIVVDAPSRASGHGSSTSVPASRRSPSSSAPHSASVCLRSPRMGLARGRTSFSRARRLWSSASVHC